MTAEIRFYEKKQNYAVTSLSFPNPFLANQPGKVCASVTVSYAAARISGRHAYDCSLVSPCFSLHSFAEIFQIACSSSIASLE